MIYNKLNAGCGYQLINEDGWLNSDIEYRGQGQENFLIWDLTQAPNKLENDLTERFNFILLNHVLLCFSDYEVHQVLINLHRALKPEGKLHVIDMNLLKVIKAYSFGLPEDIPIETGTLDGKFCHAIDGYGTRKSVFTPLHMYQTLYEAGFKTIVEQKASEYDTRPKESLVFEAFK